MAQNTLMVGAHAVVSCNARVCGRVSELSYDLASPVRAIHVVDTLLPAELVRGPVGISGTLTVYRQHRDGGAEGWGLIGTWADLQRERHFTLFVEDLVTRTQFLRADRCSVTGQTWRVVRGYVVGVVQWQGLAYANEVAPAG